MSDGSRRDLYQEVTAQIIAALENAQGELPWVRPWGDVASSGPVRNGISGTAYRGVNTLLLGIASMTKGYTDSRFLTFKQASEAGFKVRKGEHGSRIVFFKPHAVEDKRRIDPETGKPDVRMVPVLQTYVVFNAQQIDGMPPLEAARPPDWNPIEEAERLVARNNPTLRIGADSAYFSPAGDFIAIPDRSAFASAEQWYSVLLHELSHWSGGEARLNRALANRFGSEGYAREELICEIAAASLCAETGVPHDIGNHAGYIQSWIKCLKNDGSGREIFRAASQAQQVCDYLQGRYQPQQKAEAKAEMTDDARAFVAEYEATEKALEERQPRGQQPVAHRPMPQVRGNRSPTGGRPSSPMPAPGPSWGGA